MELSQSRFSHVMGIKVKTLQSWESGRYVPEYYKLLLEALEERTDKIFRIKQKAKSLQGKAKSGRKI